MDDAMDLISHARKLGVRNLSFSNGKLKVEFYPPKDIDPADLDPDLMIQADPDRPAKRQASRVEDATGGLLTGEDAMTLMNPYHDIED